MENRKIKLKEIKPTSKLDLKAGLFTMVREAYVMQ